jgi:hypothetical protein
MALLGYWRRPSPTDMILHKASLGNIYLFGLRANCDHPLFEEGGGLD